MDVREKLIEQAISHFLYGVSHDIFSEPVTTYAKLAIEALEKEKEIGVTVQEWISVKDRLPEPEQEVFVCVRTKISNYRYVCCAMHVPENLHRQSSDFCWDFECCDEYDEEQDDFIVTPGWYESIHNWGDYSVVGIEDIVTHWMPMPQPPKVE